ncbi:hypothetical protein ACFSSA_06570 [Luteolibacter algae]|uniref:DUF4440 domain-containing protein n=1 Tax=Luteolibacter algae TaxID=454151 RepID=A0ABW5D6H3_9BACT
MTRPRIIIAAVLLLILVPTGMWWFSPEQVIMRRTKHLMEVLTLSEGIGGPLRQAKVYSMNGMLAPEVEMITPDISEANGTFDKQEIESAFSWICQNAKRSNFRITEYRDVEIEGERARVRVFVEGYIEIGATRPADGYFEVVIHWVKGGDGWRFEKVIWQNS